MSTFAVTAERLTILPHPNADALELAQVGLYRAIVRKGQFSTGDYALYIPEQAILPDALIEELGLTGRLAGKAKNRVKAVRLRGELSQGIVALPAAAADIDLEVAASYGEDFKDFLGITKWVPEVPASMGGNAFGATELLGWVDIENIKRFPDIFTDGEEVSATEKLHGTCTISTLVLESDEFFMTSKGLGAKNLALTESSDNLYWRSASAYDIKGFARFVGSQFDGLLRTAIYGETYGTGIQDLAYGANGHAAKPGFAVFDIQVEQRNGEKVWLDQDVVRSLTSQFRIPMTPELYRGGYDFAALSALAEGKETITGTESNIREGIVVRPVHERRSEVLGGRAIGKIVGETYLLRKNATEFE